MIKIIFEAHTKSLHTIKTFLENIAKSLYINYISVQLLSCVQLFETPWTSACQVSRSITNSRSSLRLTSIESVMPSSLSSSVVPFSSCPQSLPASEYFPMSQLFAWGGQSTGVSALASFPSKEIPGLISIRMDWLDLLAVQGTLKSLLQHHSSILRCSAFFTVQLNYCNGAAIKITFMFLNDGLSLNSRAARM